MLQFKNKEEFINTSLSKYMPKYQKNGKLSTREMLKMANLASKNGHK